MTGATRRVLLVLVLGFVVRAGFLGLLYGRDSIPGGETILRSVLPHTWQNSYGDIVAGRPFSDGLSFDRIARNLLDGNGYRMFPDGPPTAFRPPAYPLLLAFLYALPGDDTLRVRIVQLLLELAVIAMIVSLGRRVFASETVGLVAGTLYAVYHPMVLYSATMFSETFFTFWLALFVWLLTGKGGAGESPPSPRRWLAAGAVLGVATLTKPTTLLFPLFFLIPVLWRRPVSRFLRTDLLRGVLPLAAGLLVVLAPWTIRNAIIFGELIPVATGGGRAFWACNVVEEGDPMMSEAGEPLGRDDVDTDQSFYRQAIANIVSHPGIFIRSALTKFVRLWFNLGYPHPPSGASLLVGGFNLALMASLAVALLLHRGTWLGRASPQLLLLLYFSLVHMALVGYIRYALPVMPYLMLLGAFGAVRSWSRLRGSGEAPAVRGGTGA